MQKLETWEGPVAMLFNNAALCDIDLSPGGLTFPSSFLGAVIRICIELKILFVF
jgi:hypothetical protein